MIPNAGLLSVHTKSNSYKSGFILSRLTFLEYEHVQFEPAVQFPPQSCSTWQSTE
jgi:hypothetical protein